MYRIFSILLIDFIFSCQPDDKKIVPDNSTNQTISSSDSLSQLNKFQNCKKCDKAIIETATERWDKLTHTQLEQFLCSFDKKCSLNAKYKNSGGTYKGVAFDMLVVQLDKHLGICTKLFDTNKNIDFAYILSLLESAAGHDLPWPSIISQLDKKTKLTSTEQKILDTLKKSESEWKQKHIGIKLNYSQHGFAESLGCIKLERVLN